MHIFKRKLAMITGVTALILICSITGCTNNGEQITTNSASPVNRDLNLRTGEKIKILTNNNIVNNISTPMSYSGNSEPLSATDELALKEAITVVKKRITIPEEYSLFDYELSNKYNSTSFTLRWTKPAHLDKEEEYISVTIIGNTIISFVNSASNTTSSDFPKFSKLELSELEHKSKEYFKMLNPQIKSELKYNVSSLSLYTSNADVNFKRYENGIYVKGNQGQIILNKDTGELASFNMTWWDLNGFESTDKIKSIKEVQNSFKKICAITPYYEIDYDYNTKKYFTRLVYCSDDTKEIDAKTGQWSTIWDEMKSANGTKYYSYAVPYMDDTSYTYNALESVKSVDDNIKFTDAELEKIDIDEGLLKGEDVRELLCKNETIKLPKTYQVTSYNIYKDEENYFARVSFNSNTQNAYAEAIVNAKTGEIISFNKNSSDSEKKLNVEKSNNIANAAFKVLVPSKYQTQFRADENNLRQAWEDEESNYYETERTFYYERFINNIKVDNQLVEIGVDNEGNIIKFSYNITDVDFIEPNILSVSDAFDKLYQQKDFDLYYDCWVDTEGKIHPYILYNMDSFYMDAITGELISNWSYYSDDDTDISTIKYTDIDDIPQKDKIEELLKYNICLSETNKFNPNKVVTTEEFEKILSVVLQQRLYGFYVSNNNIESKKLTSRLAAEIFTRKFDSNNIAFISGIYKSPFSDVADNDKYVGCFAISNAKHFLIGDKDNKIHPNKELTRTNVIDIIYDYIDSCNFNK